MLLESGVAMREATSSRSSLTRHPGVFLVATSKKLLIVEFHVTCNIMLLIVEFHFVHSISDAFRIAIALNKMKLNNKKHAASDMKLDNEKLVGATSDADVHQPHCQCSERNEARRQTTSALGSFPPATQTSAFKRF